MDASRNQLRTLFRLLLAIGLAQGAWGVGMVPTQNATVVSSLGSKMPDDKTRQIVYKHFEENRPYSSYPSIFAGGLIVVLSGLGLNLLRRRSEE